MYNRDMELLLERAIILQSVCYDKLVKIKDKLSLSIYYLPYS